MEWLNLNRTRRLVGVTKEPFLSFINFTLQNVP